MMKRATKTRKLEEPSIVRTTGRIKKAKVVYDPSDNYLPKNQRSSAGSVQNQPQSDNPSDSSNERKVKEEKPRINSVDSFDGSCYICGRRENKKNKTKLISCKDCDHKAHISCLQLDFEDNIKLRENYRCDICQICSSCYEGPEDGELITCTKCVKSFHFACHIPSMARFPTQSKWFCSKCTIPKTKSLLKVLGIQNPQPQEKSSDEEKQPIAATEILTTETHKKEIDNDFVKRLPSSSPIFRRSPISNVPPSPNSVLLPLPSRSNSHDLPEIPVVKNWSVSQVTEYFTKFFPNEADIFKDQDIDGQSLLLLKRSDVVNRLAIKLGPALRIYNLILKIQSLSTDPTLGW